MKPTLTDLLGEAITDIRALQGPVVQVCGPITTGGHGSVAANIAALRTAIEYLQAHNIAVFDQTKYEEPFKRILDNSRSYDERVLHEFYEPLFVNGHINELVFLPRWQSSFGARWEHERGKVHGLAIHYW